MARYPTTRDQAERDIEALYSLTSDWRAAAFEHFDLDEDDGLTDDAIIWIAQQQIAAEMAR